MYCTICNPHSHWPDWISMTEHIKRDHVEARRNPAQAGSGVLGHPLLMSQTREEYS